MAATPKIQVPSVITPAATSTVKASAKSAERQGYQRLRLTASDFTGDDGAVSANNLSRLMGLLQDNIHEATLPARSSPLGLFNIVQKVSLSAGVNAFIPHGLGSPFAYWQVVRQRSGDPFSAVEIANNGGMDPAQYLALIPYLSGVYDIAIYAG